MPTAGSYSAQALPPVASGESDTTSTWNGCIEERDTTNTITGSASGYTIPGSAFDLDINRIPTNDATAGGRWAGRRPSPHRRIDQRDQRNLDGRLRLGLPAAVRLTGWTRVAMQNYVNTRCAARHTYHDIGMLGRAHALRQDLRRQRTIITACPCRGTSSS